MSTKVIGSLLVAACLCLGLVLNDFTSQSENELPVYGKTEVFTLQAARGENLNSDQLKGSIWLGNFFFTSCKGICPTIMGEVAKVQRTFADDDRVKVVSITVDPKADTAEKLLEYKRGFISANDRWYFLRGQKDYIDQLSEKGFQLAASADVNGHSRRVVLVDKKGQIRGYYNGLEEAVSKKIIADIFLLRNLED